MGLLRGLLWVRSKLELEHRCVVGVLELEHCRRVLWVFTA